MNEGDEKREALLAGARQAVRQHRRRVAEVRAREHVGAAGWAQASTLEAIIRAGREGAAATEALRQVVHLTTEGVRSLPLAAPDEAREAHARALAEAAQSGEEQMTAAEILDDLVRRALDEVAQTPVADLNVRVLQGLQERVQAQVAALSTIIEAARAQAQTLEEVAHLGRLSAEHQARVDGLRQLSAREEVERLGQVGEEIVERIAEVGGADAHGLHALERIGEAVIEKVPETGAAPAEQAQVLEDLARAVQEQAEALQDG